MGKIAFVTYQGLPELTGEDQLAAEALRRHGHLVEACVWTDDAVDWSVYDSIVVRSTWDYHVHIDRWSGFLDRLESLNANVWNPVATIRWNMDKAYLTELNRYGILVPETVWIDAGAVVDLRSVLKENRWSNAVVKPNQSATAHNTWLVDHSNIDRVQEQLSAILTSKSMMVQQFLPEIRTVGEWSLIFFNNEYSHAVLKKPAAGDFRVQSNFGGTEEAMYPEVNLIDEAEKVLYTIPKQHLYARVDAVISEGAFYLMELELIEPQLFLNHENGSVERFIKSLLLK